MLLQSLNKNIQIHIIHNVCDDYLYILIKSLFLFFTVDFDVCAHLELGCLNCKNIKYINIFQMYEIKIVTHAKESLEQVLGTLIF